MINQRAKYIFAIGAIAIIIGALSKKTVSYPTECMSDEITFYSSRVLT